MSEIPETVRFHFARQAPSPWNWYTRADFQGCALRWNEPKGNVSLYIVFRSSENLPSDCCEDLLAGHYDDVVERIDIFKPITRLVDDEIHDKNRYLVLARLDNDDLIWINDVESSQFSGAAPGENWTYWSNPYGDTPMAKDPCRLDYLTVRVDTFCGFEWDYPDQYPEFVGYDLIVSDIPYSPHTGAESDIEAFQAVLRGEKGTTYSLDRFVNAIVDNESFVNRFCYYALLIRMPESGRIQIPMRHVSTPFEKGKPFQYLKARSGWGEGRDRMMSGYARWKAQCAAKKAQQPQSVVSGTEDIPAISETLACEKIGFFRHSPDLTLESYKKNPWMFGIQFRAKVAEGADVIAVRADYEMTAAGVSSILIKTRDEGRYNDEHCDAFAYRPENGFMLIVDTDCHKRSWYAFATWHDGKFEEIQNVRDTTIDFLPSDNAVTAWGTNQIIQDHLVHCLALEKFQKKNCLAIRFGILDDANISSIELYCFDTPLEWDEETVNDFHAFQKTGTPKLGQRFVINHSCKGIMDDVTACDTFHYYAALCVDHYGNRFPVNVSSLGNVEQAGWEFLSKYSSKTTSKVDVLNIVADSGKETSSESISSVSQVKRHYEEETSTTRRKYSWDDDSDSEPVETSSSSRRKYSWDDDSDSKAEDTTSSSRGKYSWDDDSDSKPTESA
ncbi:MAG: hypothetical protein IJU23_12285, partial [Proteobacteria bacterium]|nr:hypothetical protein [Pseudomonadota bacterium]